MSSVALHCFGVGDGLPNGDRNHSSYLYRFRNIGLLVDSGEPVSRQIKAAGLSYSAFNRLLLSHMHADHFGGFFMLLQSCWLDQREQKLTVHLPGYAIEPLRRMLETVYLFPDALPFPLRFDALSATQPIPIDDGQITPFANGHLEGFRRKFAQGHSQPFEAFSFLIESGGLRIGHSADIGAVEDLEPLLEKPLDWLVCELAHVEPEKLLEFLNGRQVGRLVLVHLNRTHWENRDALQRKAEEQFGEGRIFIPEDGEVLA